MGRNHEGAIPIDIETRAVHMPDIDWPKNSASPPLFQTAAYAYHSVETVDRILSGDETGFTYTRSGNPTTEALEKLLASLEGAARAVVTASGSGAMLAGILALLPRPGALLVAREIYGGTVGLARRILEPMGYTFHWIDTHQLDELPQLFRQFGGILIAETISNPLGRVCPLDAIIPLAHQAQVKVLVDNTFATPYHAAPLDWGADLVVHSLTKFIGGHSDLILGAVLGSGPVVDSAREIVDVMGLTPDPFASWLAFRGARTLPLRMERASQNALSLAQWLTTRPEVDAVHYPGLSEHEDHQHAARLLKRGYGAVLSMRLRGGLPAVEAMASRLQHVQFVPSLGDVATTISHPVVASHRELSREEKEAVRIDDGVVRVSVGIEQIADVTADFEQALKGGEKGA